MIGLIGKKEGMTQVFDENGIVTPVTVIHVEPNVVVEKRTVGKNGYSALLLGAEDMKESRVTKPYVGQFEKKNISPKKHLFEVRDFDGDYAIGDTIDVNLFQDKRFVDVIGMTKGKGYQGVMKRHGFSGGKKSHGSKFHRAGGSTGMAASPSKVLKGTKMAGRMGNTRATVQNLRVIKVDPEKNTLVVRGPVPGINGNMVFIKNAKKKS